MKKYLTIFILLIAFWSNAFGQNQLFFAQNTASGWNVLSGVYVNYYDISAQGTYQTDCYILNDTCVFFVEYVNNKVYQYSITESGLVYRKSATVTTSPENIDFKSDGTKMYIADVNYVYQYNLSTAWNITTLSLATSKSFNTYSAAIAGIKFSDDGYYIYVGSDTYNSVNKYVLSTAWDISTATTGTYENELSLGTISTSDFNFGDDGKLIAVTDIVNKLIKVYDLATPYDLTTNSFKGSLSTSAAGIPYGFGFDKNGYKIFICADFSGNVFNYNIQ